MMKDIKLTNGHIDQASYRVEEFLYQEGLESAELVRMKLAVEETLLKYQEVFGTEAVFSLRCLKRLTRLRLELSIPGEGLDVIEAGGQPDSEILRGILAGMGVLPTWQYKNGKNVVVFTPRKRKKLQIFPLAAAIVLALFCGGMCQLLPDSTGLFFSKQLVTPLFDTAMGFLSAVAGPMIFLSVICGIYGLGDLATLGRVGKRMILRFLLLPFVWTLLVLVALLPFFRTVSGGGGSLELSGLQEMILDIVPDNMLSPFLQGNPMQIVFLAIIFGMALLVLGNRVAVVASVMEQANALIQLVMEGVGVLVPFFIFCSLFNMLVSSRLSMLLNAYQWLLLQLIGSIVLLAAYTGLVCIRRKTPPLTLIKKLLPVFLIGLTTDSSSAAFSTNVETCEKELGIDHSIVSFGIPLGQVVFKPGAAVLFLSAGICMAGLYGVPVTPAWLFLAWLTTVVLSIAAPPVAGGGLTCFTILFMQLGIPTEAIALTVALNVILEFPATAVNLFCLQAELVDSSGSLGMLDLERLHGKKHRGGM
ncbi:MAG: dicarboxylate/amino acid:cation symporter [Lachnospiraceae bacterium]|nr:dicarboxylate/amino acid:cation symporter [Lachnospiraceae bacterium]